MRSSTLPGFAIAFLLQGFVGAAPPQSDSLATEWNRFGRGPRPEQGHSKPLDDGLGDILWSDAHSHRRLADVVKEIAGRFHVRPDTAADLIEATLVTHGFPDRYSDKKPSSAQAERAASALWRAYQREPGTGIVLQQAGWVLFELGRGSTRDRRVLEELRRSTDPAPLAARIAWLGLCDNDTRRAAVAIALERRPSHPVLLLSAAALDNDDPCMSAAWAREALESASAAGETNETFLTTARNRLLAALLGAGLHREVIDAVSSIPADQLPVRSARAHGSLAGLEYEVFVAPIRSALASAAFLVNEGDLARRLASSPASPPASDPRDRDEAERLELVRLAIDWLSADASPDPFDILDRAIVVGEYGQPLSTTLLFARLARESGYSAITAELLTLERPIEAKAEASPESLAAWIDGCRLRSARASDDFARQLGTASVSAPETDPASEILARRLAAEPSHVYSERPLPENVSPWEPQDPERERLGKALAKWKLPGLWPVRVERNGATVIAIGLSQDYDPAGEVSGGGYWFVRSSDGGKTWGRALYAGIRPMQPYVIRSFSHLPLEAGDRLRIEVEVRELDTSKIMFPPITRSFARERKGLFLDVAWADLERDSDADGLTDLAEERLMTDPLAEDTDGDGLPDDADSLPHIARASRPSAQTGALAAVLWSVVDKSARPILPGDPGGQGPAEPGFHEKICNTFRHAVALTSEATMFIVADRPAFAGLSLDRRVVVLSPTEASLAEERFGVHYPGTLRLYVDHTGTRALVIWDEAWRGMTLRLRNEGGTWKSTVVRSWVT